MRSISLASLFFVASILTLADTSAAQVENEIVPPPLEAKAKAKAEARAAPLIIP